MKKGLKNNQKAVIYCRSAVVNNKAIQFQTQECMDFAKRRNLAVSKIFIDNGKGGMNLNRSGIRSLLEYSRTNSFDFVIATGADRFSRSVSSFFELKKKLSDANIAILYTQGISAEPISSFMGIMEISMAEFYSYTLSRKIKLGLERRKNGR